MKQTLVALSLCALLGLPGALVQACSDPGDKPAIPDPQTAETAQMVKANREVQAYVQAMETYLGCADMTSGEKEKELAKLEEFAAEFNQAIKAFKARD